MDFRHQAFGLGFQVTPVQPSRFGVVTVDLGDHVGGVAEIGLTAWVMVVLPLPPI
jgi:hypothetical protein